MKSPLYILTYSVVLILVWGLMLLDAEFSTIYSRLLCFIATAYFTYLIKESQAYKQLKYAPILIMIGPLFYLVMFLINFSSIYLIIYNPIIWIIMFFLFAILKLKLTRDYIFIVLFITYFYNFHVYPYYTKANRSNSATTEIVAKELNKAHNLKDFEFEGDEKKFTIDTTKKIILIETWNEKCPPCMSSIRDLEGFIDSQSTVQHVYLYQDFGKDNLPPNKIFEFSKIADKGKIFIDSDNTYFKTLEMNSYPNFLVYNTKGELIDYFTGYVPSKKEEYKTRLKKMFVTAGK